MLLSRLYLLGIYGLLYLIRVCPLRLLRSRCLLLLTNGSLGLLTKRCLLGRGRTGLYRDLLGQNTAYPAKNEKKQYKYSNFEGITFNQGPALNNT